MVLVYEKRNGRKASDLLPPCQQATETQYELGIKLRKQVQELRFSVPSSTEKMDYIVQVSSRFTWDWFQ